MSSQLRNRYDIIVNGGGIVGFTLLNLILKSPQLSRSKVLLIEQATKPSNFHQPSRGSDTEDRHENKFSNRVSSLTSTSKFVFKKLGVWDLVRPYAKDVKSIKVWNYDYSDKIVFRQNISQFNEDKEERYTMLSTLENNRLSNALLENIFKHENADEKIAWDYKLKHLDESLDNGLVDVKIESNQTGEELNMSAFLVLGCDGLKSKVRELTRMKYRESDLKKTAIVGTVRMSTRLDMNENDIAYQKFSAEKDTVAALLPLDKDFSSFVISAPNDYAKYLMDCSDITFVQEFNRILTTSESPVNPVLKGIHGVTNSAYDGLQSLLQSLSTSFRPTFDTNAGLDEPPSLDYVVSNSRASFPLVFGTTSPNMVTSLSGLSMPQIALLGDSSHRIHPLAGQGLNLGIQDAFELVKQLEAIAKTGERVFDNTNLSKALRRYELRRQAYIMPISASILAMQDLFRLVPSRMISSVNKCNSFKTASVRIANGCL